MHSATHVLVLMLGILSRGGSAGLLRGARRSFRVRGGANDVEGAVGLCRKALEEDPSRTKARWSLALLLEGKSGATSTEKLEARGHFAAVASDDKAPLAFRARAALKAGSSCEDEELSTPQLRTGKAGRGSDDASNDASGDEAEAHYRRALDLAIRAESEGGGAGGGGGGGGYAGLTGACLEKWCPLVLRQVHAGNRDASEVAAACEQAALAVPQEPLAPLFQGAALRQSAAATAEGSALATAEASVLSLGLATSPPETAALAASCYVDASNRSRALYVEAAAAAAAAGGVGAADKQGSRKLAAAAQRHRLRWVRLEGLAAVALGEAGDNERAEVCFHRAVAAAEEVGGLGLGWAPAVEGLTNLGVFLKERGRTPEAVAALKRALVLGKQSVDDEDCDMGHASVQLASLQPEGLDEESVDLGAKCLSPCYVSQLFDAYSDSFEASLTGKLLYTGHRLVVDAAVQAQAKAGSSSLGSVIDLGCGTGLVGAALVEKKAARYSSLVGVDLSDRMAQLAKEKGCYDEVAVRDIFVFLEGCEASSCNTVLAADVFLYTGDLEPALEAIARVLCSGGHACFTVEALPAASSSSKSSSTSKGVRLLPSGRYGHSEAHVYAAAAAAGLAVTCFQSPASPLRFQNGVPVEGFVVTLRKG